MVHFHTANPNLRHAIKPRPFRFRHEAEEQIEHFFPANIQEVSATDVQRRAIHILAAAEPTRLGLLLQHEKRIFSLRKQSMGEGKAGWTRAENEELDPGHAAERGQDGTIPSNKPPANKDNVTEYVIYCRSHLE